MKPRRRSYERLRDGTGCIIVRSNAILGCLTQLMPEGKNINCAMPGHTVFGSFITHPIV
jgi:hypothetical protein